MYNVTCTNSLSNIEDYSFPFPGPIGSPIALSYGSSDEVAGMTDRRRTGSQPRRLPTTILTQVLRGAAARASSVRQAFGDTIKTHSLG